MATHAKLSPSSSAQWATCKGSIGLIAANAHRIPADNGSAAADEGTLAHSHAAEALVMGFNADRIADKIMGVHVKAYVDYVESHLSGTAELQVEQRVPLWYSPEEGGTVDAWVLEEKCLHIFDLKYGAGVMVDAERNTQLAIYAESLVRQIGKVVVISMDFDVKLHIFQPRAREGDTAKVWSLTRRELQDFTDHVEDAARQIHAAATEPDFVLPLVPSEKACRWCKAKSICPARAEAATADLPIEMIEDIFNTKFAVDALPDDLLVRIAKVALEGNLVGWLADVQEYVEGRLRKGELQGQGLKLVAANAHRKWADEAAALKLLKQKLKTEDLLTEKLVSPSAAEKLLKGLDLSTKYTNKLDSLITKPEGAPTLATEDDKRPALQPVTAAAEFPPEEDLL